MGLVYPLSARRRRSPLLACVSAFALAAVASAQSTPAAPTDRSAAALASGQALVQAGRFADAIPELERADRLAGGRSAAIAVALARAYAGAGAHARALEEAREALARNSDVNTGNEARILLCQNRPEAAADVDPAEAARKVGDGVAPPQIIHRVSPPYPAALRKARLDGTVVVLATVDEDGCVAAAGVTRGAAPEFDAAALAAVRQWVYRPAIAEGQPVRVTCTLTIKFDVEKTPPPPYPPSQR